MGRRGARRVAATRVSVDQGGHSGARSASRKVARTTSAKSLPVGIKAGLLVVAISSDRRCRTTGLRLGRVKSSTMRLGRRCTPATEGDDVPLPERRFPSLCAKRGRGRGVVGNGS